MIKSEITPEIILGYRKVINNRYQFQALQEKIGLPASFTEERVNLIKDYFLTHLYPPPQEREALNEAFDSLDDYIKQPEKLLRLLLDSSRLLFKHGRHLPKILMAGLKALSSFKTASKFENDLVETAMRLDLKPPYEIENIKILIKELPKSEVDQFIENSQSLFEILYDRKLVKKILEIVANLISKMRKRPNIYSEVEVNGLEIGQKIIQKGDALFETLTPEEQKIIFKKVVDIERDFLEEIFES